MSGEIDLQRGFLFNENDSDEVVTVGMLNKLVGDLVARISAGSISNREIADGTISADKLSVAVNSQLGVADGSITRAKIVDDAINGDKIEDDAIAVEHLSDGSVGTSQIADSAVTENKLADGAVAQDKLAIGAGMCVSAFRATMTADQLNMTLNTWVDAEIDNQEYDLNDEFDPSTFTFSPEYDGVYKLEAVCHFEDASASTSSLFTVRASLNIDGTSVAESVAGYNTEATRANCILSWVGALTAGQTVKIRVNPGPLGGSPVDLMAFSHDGKPVSFFQGYILRRTE